VNSPGHLPRRTTSMRPYRMFCSRLSFCTGPVTTPSIGRTERFSGRIGGCTSRLTIPPQATTPGSRTLLIISMARAFRRLCHRDRGRVSAGPIGCTAQPPPSEGPHPSQCQVPPRTETAGGTQHSTVVDDHSRSAWQFHPLSNPRSGISEFPFRVLIAQAARG